MVAAEEHSALGRWRAARPLPIGNVRRAGAHGANQQTTMDRGARTGSPPPSVVRTGSRNKAVACQPAGRRTRPHSAGMSQSRTRGGADEGYIRPRREASPCPDRSSLVIFVDWDDTLFPTSELLAKALLHDSMTKQQPQLPDSVAKQLRQLEQNVLDFLTEAHQKGHLVIVTNAARGWIDQLTEWAMPRVGLYMERKHIAVRYARECVGSDPRDVQTWKQATFCMEAERARARLSYPRPLSLVSVGDMPYERDAAHTVAKPDDTVKTIKFLEDPTLRELQHELQALVQAMPQLTAAGQEAGVTDLEMHSQEKTQPGTAAAQARAQPEPKQEPEPEPEPEGSGGSFGEFAGGRRF